MRPTINAMRKLLEVAEVPERAIQITMALIAHSKIDPEGFEETYSYFDGLMENKEKAE